MKPRRPTQEFVGTVDSERISRHLDHTGHPEFAEFVRHLDGAATRANQRYMRLEGDYREVLRRLEAYEPPVVEREHDPTPPPEASG